MKTKKLRMALLSPSMILIYVILLFSFAVALSEPAFFSPAMVINTLRAGIFTACFALCEMLVILAGGIDVSFPAIGCVSMCVPMYLYENGLIPDNALLFFLIAAFCGLILGSLNGFMVSCLGLLPLIATLATSAIASGGLILLLGAKEYTDLPSSLRALYEADLFTYTEKASGFTYPMTSLILFPVILALVMAFVLRYTMLGRGLYAVGGSLSAAVAVGFDTRKLRFFTYAASGVITGVTAMIYTTLLHSASATALMGDEMLVIAACVIGGCRLSGGHGTVHGTLLGVLLITLVKNNLNMLGIPTSWQTFAVGVVLLVSVLITAVREKFAAAHQRK